MERETIGKVSLDYTYYPGKDLYSDGPVEEELLKIAQTCTEEQLNQVIAERKSWPVLYHFSHIRQNIVNWLPITKEDSILEIGSGCGAITGALAEKGKDVTCIELSRKRSLINANRNKEYGNIEILVGNFQDIEKNLPETYDYITLIGVFEYSEGYIGGENPYTEMMTRISRHLAPGGKLVIAIENQLGLKYWAGCTEDHVGKYFEGLEGYPQTEGVKTFSRKALKDLIESAGNFRTEFYYPYPDYKFPMILFSDDYLPKKGDLSQNFSNFDRMRIQLFDEPRVYDTLTESGLFPEFSNSFLVLVERV
ncbi:SAM-dependent methyltransferase [Blautia sp. An249]|uniref:class I SAM-dependent methyltransferase n=1 Tax=Blautia sp. An249 TaxID=1965603 RepID=UPI000B39F80C|nr:class I SAM-dependent methyltransferase [Blautia sp. An249]OUO79854.1 SAM-dependent methyltransferase [Blautia sp. An249]